jgi:hypothetical protein
MCNVKSFFTRAINVLATAHCNENVIYVLLFWELRGLPISTVMCL